ncbi:MAG: hypothetical protein V1725_05460 [archaeon]
MPELIREDCKDMLAELVRKEDICFTDTWESAIILALKFAHDKGFSTVLVPDQGGIVPSQDLLERLDMTAIIFPTKHGLFLGSIMKHYDRVVLFANSMPSFAVLADFYGLNYWCQQNNIFLINDVSGSIGTKQATYGNVAVCNFEKAPLQSGGAMIAANSFKDFFRMNFKKAALVEEDELYANLMKLPLLRERLLSISRIIKKDLVRFDIIHRYGDGWNVLIETTDEKEKETLIKYCEQHKHRYLLCPTRERMLRPGISIELIEA